MATEIANSVETPISGSLFALRRETDVGSSDLPGIGVFAYQKMNDKQEKTNQGAIEPFYKKGWFVVLSTIFIVYILGILIGTTTETPIAEQTISPAPSVATSGFICPENYADSKTAESALYKFIKDYLDKNPEATGNDISTYRYSLLIKNNCRKTLDYISGKAEGEDSLNSFVQKVQQDYRQNILNSNSPVSEEKSAADIIAEWQDRVAQVTCMFFENTGTVTAQGSATIVKLRHQDGSVYMTAITNRHVLVDNNNSPLGCIVGIYGKGSRSVENPTAFLVGESEDYGYINLDKATNINETKWEAKYSYDIKNCSSSNINLGDNIVILGYPGIGTVGGLTVTKGIISGVEKNYYVTDAKIDHGNSGGAAILLKDDCYLGIPSSSSVGSIESMGRILKASFVIN